MGSQPYDESQLTRYLLGQLAEEEQTQVEDRAFSDPDYLAALEAAEADLIDAYVRGELARADRLEFERRFLTSPRRRSKVEFSRALKLLAAEAPPLPAAASGGGFWQSLLGANWSVKFRFAASLATLVVVLGAGWLAVENAGMRSRIASLESQGRDLQARNAAAEQQLSAERSRAGGLTAELQKQGSSRSGPGPVIASLVLLPGLTRAEASQARLAVPPSAQLARIEVQLEARDAYPRYRAELRTLRGQEVFSVSNLQRRQSPSGYSVSFDVPVSALESGEYELELRGLSADRTSRELGYYYFQLLRQ